MKRNRTNYWVDTHAHLQLKAYDKANNRENLLRELFGFHFFKKGINRVKKVVNVAISFESNEQQLNMIEGCKYSNQLYMVCGIHPNFVGLDSDTDSEKIDVIKNKYIKHKKCVGIGETGLDYNRIRKKNSNGDIDFEYVENMASRQAIWFRKCIELSIESKMPLVLHIRNSEDQISNLKDEKYSDAYKDAIEILREYFDESGSDEVRGVCHSFNGSKEQMEEIIKLGFMISFNGMFTRPEYDYLRSCVDACPLEKMILETDSPYLSPYTLNGERTGKQNTPLSVPLIGQWVSEIKHVNIKEIQKITTENATKLFSL